METIHFWHGGVLSATNDYLLRLPGMKSCSNADFPDLCLSDTMIDVLQEGHVDTALPGSRRTTNPPHRAHYFYINMQYCIFFKKSC